MKADDSRPEREDEVESLLVEGWEKLLRLRYRSQLKFVEVGCELGLHGRYRLRVGARPRMGEEIDIERTVGRFAQYRHLLPHRYRRQRGATDRTQRAGIAHGRREGRRCEAAHRCLDDGMGDSNQVE